MLPIVWNSTTHDVYGRFKTACQKMACGLLHKPLIVTFGSGHLPGSFGLMELNFLSTTDVRSPQLKESRILSLLTAKDGGLWIGTEGGGIVLYRNHVFRLFSAPEGLTNGFRKVCGRRRPGSNLGRYGWRALSDCRRTASKG